ncbi:competence type IV pilus major pilin ComGC [Alkalihalobacillus sp. AL-G]|uniref:competence type IV pilus major pilin ComGC n=1 Tax=Alkalihalobacillus sp. AL-G TaxID=2926399 RepID=UPI00272C0EE0|nr:competence type IV pilus major pilin ComGC [Alkalihalobacillus sp. AL-G]WLD92051.1 prepilin-type N-terminal cleavage/methylation domain-containing protein [Alkalihalobacillus sp. AL-G]
MKEVTGFVYNEKAFTLIEMMIVILIISILLLIAVPSMSKSNQIVKDKSCLATIDLIQSQVAAYQINEGTLPIDLNGMLTDGYIDQTTCPGGQQLEITFDGTVQKVGTP